MASIHRLLQRSFLLFLAALAAACTRLPIVEPRSVGLSAERLARVHRMLGEQVDQKQIPGAVALISRRGKTVFLDAVGMQDVEARRPMVPDAIFRICSMTKPITTVAAMMLEEEGRLSLSDPVSRFLPEFRNLRVAEAVPGTTNGAAAYVERPAQREITILDLITHTSGLTYGFKPGDPVAKLYRDAGVSDGLVETEGTIADNVKRLAALPLKHQPGAVWEYGLSTDVLGRVVEVASGTTLEQYFKRRIFRPLGMRDTHFRLPPGKRSRLVEAYRPRTDGTIERLPGGPIHLSTLVYSASYPYANQGYYSGGAGLVSTVPDYHRFLQMLLRGGELDGVRLLKRETVERMTRDHSSPRPIAFKSHGDVFGLGFGVVTEAAKDEGLGSVGTYSWGGFYFTYFWVDPKQELVGIVMSQLHPWGNNPLWSEFRKLAYEALAD